MRNATATYPAVQVEYRAATVEEIQHIDLDTAEPVLPAYLFLPKDRWREAIAPFPRELIGGYHRRLEHWGPPGAAIWAQQASRSGDVIVGGRDRAGLPSVPMAAPNGDVHFLPARTASGFTDPDAPSSWIEMPNLAPVDFESDEHLVCRPLLSHTGPITCGIPTCHNCLGMTQRSTWYSMVACMCPDSFVLSQADAN